MFELNAKDIIVASNIGPQKKSAIIIDNFYKDPDSIRELCLNSKESADYDNSDLPGPRSAVKVDGMQKKLRPLFDELCSDLTIWGKSLKRKPYDNSWKLSEFICNYINDETLLKSPVGSLPHQDAYKLMEEYYTIPPTQFGVVIYLNTPEQCQGGTNLYSLDGFMTVDVPPRNVFGNTYEAIRNSIIDGDRWKVEHQLEMVYNRCIIFPSDVLHGQSVDLGMFTDYDRIVQVLFL